MNRAPPAPSADWAWFFDVDGTLAHIAETPESVRIDIGMRRLIQAIVANAGGAVALISGRSIADVDALFPGVRLPVAGQHGAERRDAAGALVGNPVAARELTGIRDELLTIARRHPGLRVEDKGLAIALHYRHAPQLAGYVHRAVRAIQARTGDDLQIQIGKRVVELVPAGIDKGSAVQHFMQEPPFRGRTPVFVGDDVTDEHAFAIVNDLDGYSVKVGPGATSARWRLADVNAVREWLEQATPQLRNDATASGDHT
jgi:trehalose 6-phosphate phosphatase